MQLRVAFRVLEPVVELPFETRSRVGFVFSGEKRIESVVVPDEIALRHTFGAGRVNGFAAIFVADDLDPFFVAPGSSEVDVHGTFTRPALMLGNEYPGKRLLADGERFQLDMVVRRPHWPLIGPRCSGEVSIAATAVEPIVEARRLFRRLIILFADIERQSRAIALICARFDVQVQR